MALKPRLILFLAVLVFFTVGAQRVIAGAAEVRHAKPVPKLSAPASATEISTVPAISSLLKPHVFKKMISDREIAVNARLTGLSSEKIDGKVIIQGDQEYAIYAAMLVHAPLAKTRAMLTDYGLYPKMISYIEKAQYDARSRILNVAGGIWKFKLRSSIYFEERGARWIYYRIVGGHFMGLSGDIFFEPAGERGTIVYLRASRAGSQWPPKFIIERGAEIVFAYTARKMRSYIEGKEEPKGGEAIKPIAHPKVNQGQVDATEETPQPRTRLFE